MWSSMDMLPKTIMLNAVTGRIMFFLLIQTTLHVPQHIQGEPAHICEKHRVPVDLPILIYMGNAAGE